MYFHFDDTWHGPDPEDPNLTACGETLPYGAEWTHDTPDKVHCGPDATHEPKGKKKA